MVPIVVLGVAGVLQPVEALWLAEIQAACDGLQRCGLPIDRFRDAALDRVRHGRPPAPVQTARAVGLALSSEGRRGLFLAAEQAVPAAPPASPGEPLRALRSGHRLAVLDQGPGARMEAWLARLGVADVPERRIWTTDLGALARPPRTLAFRWLASRLGAAPGDCLYVAGTEPLHRTALAAGWQVWGAAPRDPKRTADLEALVADLETAGDRSGWSDAE